MYFMYINIYIQCELSEKLRIFVSFVTSFMVQTSKKEHFLLLVLVERCVCSVMILIIIVFCHRFQLCKLWGAISYAQVGNCTHLKTQLQVQQFLVSCALFCT